GPARPAAILRARHRPRHDPDPLLRLSAGVRAVRADPQHDARQALRAAGLLPEKTTRGERPLGAHVERTSGPQGADRARAAALIGCAARAAPREAAPDAPPPP